MVRIFVFLIIPFMAISCYSHHRPSYNKNSQSNSGYFYSEKPIGVDKLTSVAIADREAKSAKDNISGRMVIYNAALSITVTLPDSTNARLTDIANKYDGYVVTIGNHKSTIRVKSNQLKLAVDDISKLGKITYKRISGEDVTDRYVDFQIRLENAKKARERYLELLEKAENVEAALKVEKELERLNGEIDSLEGRLKQLMHLSDYSTITISIEEKRKLGVLGYIGVGLYKGVRWLFVRN
jgi:cell division protein ZapA (FtsZ GTPase activity inhibitor)